MILSIINHSFRYETENVLRIFFPTEKIIITENLPEVTDDDYVITEMKCDNNVSVLTVECYISGDKITAEKIIGTVNGKDCELGIAQCLYSILKDITGTTPSWGILTGVRPSKLMRSLVASDGEESAAEYFKEKLYVSDEKTKLSISVAKAEDRIISLSKDNSYSLYVSIPFCPTRCSYCSFVSHSIEQAKKLIPDYVRLLCKELEQFSVIAEDLGLKLETIYFGGGTPTSLCENDLKTVTDAVGKYFDVSSAREYTIEAGRPDTLTKEKLQIMKNAGVSRISINPQTFNDDVLSNIGRKHTSQTTLDAFKMARDEGFDNINMDFIAGLPGDTIDSFCMSIDKAVSLEPENITIHTLALKRAARLVTGNREDTVSRETSKMLSYAAEKLYPNGYFPYYMYRQSKSVGNLENVGWCRNETECLYNIYMMEEIHSVFAAGGGAVTKLKNPYDNYIERIFNFKYPYEYISRFDELTDRKKQIYYFYENIKK